MPELPSWQKKDELAAALGLPLQKLTYWLYRLPADRRYHTFELARRSGGTRPISAPIRPVKDLQRQLLELLKVGFAPTVYVHGYVDDRSILTNAAVHLKHRWVLRVDLKDFFPTIHFGRVRGLFMGEPFNYPEPVATLLARLTTYENKLPQGAPTSPLISNLVCRGLDRKLAKLAHAERCRYSRYCDDIVFSTNVRNFPGGLAHIDRLNGQVVIGSPLEQAIVEESFKPNLEKTMLRSRAERQMVTGLVVNQVTNVPRQYVRHLRDVLYIWKNYGEGAAESAFRQHDLRNRPAGEAKFRPVIRGQVQHVGAVKGWGDPVYVRLAADLASQDLLFRPTQLPAPSVPVPGTLAVRVFCEGRTDYIHLKAALDYLQDNGQFPNIRFIFPDDDLPVRNDSQLLGYTKFLATSPQKVPCISVFDRDTNDIVRKIETEGSPKSWGRNVWSLALPLPSHRQGPRICIELLYTDADLHLKTPEGRRIYLREEFDKDGAHKDPDESVVCVNPGSAELVPQSVMHGVTKKDVALSKASFAALVADHHPPYENVNFEGFVPLIETIRKVISPPQEPGNISDQGNPPRPS